jgi:methylated-DNA-[protein]-cysteine S-methyltransferase
MSSLNAALRQAATTHTTIDSPLGDLTVVARSAELIGLYFPQHWPKPDRTAFGSEGSDVDDVACQLAEYFLGQRREFDISLRPDGDELQHQIWDLVSQVPFGQTSTYGQLARELGDGTTPQAVGAAVGRNPLCILIPCHRIVGSTGKLTGYAGGLPRKQFLLDLERIVIEHPTRLF